MYLEVLPIVLVVIGVSSDPDFDVGVDHLALQFPVRPRDVLAADDHQLDLPGRKSTRVETSRRNGTVSVTKNNARNIIYVLSNITLVPIITKHHCCKRKLALC